MDHPLNPLPSTHPAPSDQAIDPLSKAPSTPPETPAAVTKDQRQRSPINLPRLALAALAMLPAVAALWMALVFGRSTPYMDEWELVQNLINYQQHGLSFRELYAQHNEHRLLIPRLLMLPTMILAGGWDSRFGMLASVGLTVISSLMLRSLAVRSLNLSPAAGWIVLLPVNLLLFGWFQAETWTTGFQIALVIPLTAATIALRVLCGSGGLALKVPLTILIILAGMFSSGGGMLLWFVLFPCLWAYHSHELKTSKAHLLSWSALWWIVAAVSFWAYFSGLQIPANNPSRALALHNPLDALAYVMVFVGAPMIRQSFMNSLFEPGAILFGALLTGGYLIALGHVLWQWSDQAWRRAAAPWLSLGAMVLFSAGLTAVNRLEYGVIHACSVRYATPAIYFPIALLFLLPALVQRLTQQRAFAAGQRHAPLVTAGLMTLFATIATLTSLNMYDPAAARARSLRTGTAALAVCRFVNVDSLLIDRIYPSVATVVPRAIRATELGILQPGVMADSSVMPRAGDPSEGLDARIDALQVTSTQVLATGRAVLKLRGRGADAIVVCGHRAGTSAEQEPRLLTLFGSLRPAPELVNQAYRMDAWCQWTVKIDRQTLPNDIKRLSLWAFDADSGLFYPLPGAIELPSASP
jgi:hypothetical protein